MSKTSPNRPKKMYSLVLDGSASEVFAGILNEDNRWLSQFQTNGTALEYLFPTVERALSAAEIELKSIRQYIYNAGPGSVLGLRLCAMAIETWSRLYPDSKHLYAYNSLEFCAYSILEDESDLIDGLLVSDWKKGVWNALYIENRQLGKTQVIDDTALHQYKGPRFHLPQRKGWQSAPQNCTTVELAPTRLPNLIHQANLLNATSDVQLYGSAVNLFQKWTPDRHRAPTLI